MTELLPAIQQAIQSKILEIRGQEVMLDRDLAMMYGVPTKRLNEQVRRNKSRFPADFMFQLTKKEKNNVVANCDHLRDLKYSYQNPYAFTEQGVAMLSSVLNSEKAIQVNIAIMRAFIKMRQLYFSYKELADKLTVVEKDYNAKYKIHDKQIGEIFASLRFLMRGSQKSSVNKEIGFKAVK
jgi:hypothetical protein